MKNKRTEATVERRKHTLDNKLLTKLVDICGDLSDRRYRDDAIKLCNDHNVPFKVVTRIITQPEKRRKRSIRNGNF